MRIAIRKYSYLLFACCLISGSTHSLSERYKIFKRNTIHSIANCTADIASAKSASGNYTKAINYYRYQRYLLHTLLSIENDTCSNNYLTDYISSLTNLGYLYFKLGDYVHAKQCFSEILKNKKEILGEDNPSYAIFLNNLADLYAEMGDLEQTERYYLEALKIITKSIGKDHPNYAAILNNLAVHHFEMGNYVYAERYYLDILEIQKTVLGNNHPDYAISLNNLGTLYFKIGEFSQVEKYYLEALDIRKNTIGVNHVDYITSLNSLGNYYSEIGNYNCAEQYFLEALERTTSMVDSDDIYFSRALHGLGVLYAKMGNYEQAEKIMLDALKRRKTAQGKNLSYYANSLSDLANLYFTTNNYVQAEKYHLEALDIRKSSLGINHPDYANSLNSLANLYSAIGYYMQAEKYYLDALEIQQSSLGSNHPDYANSLSDLGTYYSNLGDYEQSEKYHLKALEILESSLGINHPDYIISLNKLGVLYFDIEDYNKTEEYFLKCSFLQKHQFRQSLYYMMEKERDLYWKTMQLDFDNTYPIFAYKYQFSKPSISTFAYDNELFRKGLLLSSTNAIRQSILESNDSLLIEQWNNLVGLKQVIMNLEERDSKSSDLPYYKHQADSLEKIITRSSATFRDAQAKRSITWETIRQNLSPNEVAIEYFTAPISKDSIMYCALLLRHNSKYPELIPLFEEKEINSYLSYGDNVVNNMYCYDRTRNVTHTILGKIIPKIHEGETIYFSPAGLLHQIAIEHLPYDNNRTMSEVYPMIRLSSTSEIVSMKQKGTSPNVKSAIYGGIFYDLDTHSLLTESRNYRSEDLVTYRAIQADTTNRGKVLYLSGTKKEAESIHSLLKKKDISSTLYIASKANEESFKSLSGQHCNIIHIGTHGFTWTDSTARKQDYFRQRLSMQMLGEHQLQKPTIDPLTRCGLLFAGSNIALSGHSKDLPEGVQDGILTAKEISLMDLRDANLVVLSACETAKGDITSEGVFGLQRAFKMAGAQTIIMSLWKVNDQATQMLMTEFYTNWIGKQQSKREAFKNAQNTVRTHFEEPEYWAGFIMLD